MKKSRKILLFIFCFITALLCFVFSASALGSSGQCGEDVYWLYYDETGELYVYGEGETYDYENGSSPFYNSDIKSVKILDEVTYIGKNLFRKCSLLTDAFLWSKIENIGWYSFQDCVNLVDVELPDTLKTIGMGSFKGCTKLESVSIPENLITIESSAFYNCDSITSLYIPNSITSIGSSAFYSCNGITNIDIPKNVTKIDSSAFSMCENLEKVTIGEGLKTLGSNAFYWCPNLDVISVSENNKYFSVDDRGVLFDFNKTTLILYPMGKTEETYVIPNSVTHIENNSFYSCDSIKTIIFPSGLKSIGGKAFWGCEFSSIMLSDKLEIIYEDAFYSCINLDKIYYCGSKDMWNKVNIIGIDDGNCVLSKSTLYYDCCPHSNRIDYPLQPPKCEVNGYTYSLKCSDCSEWLIISEELPALGHIQKTFFEKVNSTCISVGYTAGYLCVDCNKWVSGHEEIAINPNSHTLKSETSIEPTHTVEGIKTYTCECGYSYTETIEKTYEHHYISSVTTNPTHTTEGIRVYICECGDSYKEIIEKTPDHNYTSYITTEPTHISKGVRIYSCECGSNYEESIDILPEHIYISKIEENPTCTDKGKIKFICECGKEYSEEINALGHKEVIDASVPSTEKENGLTEGSHCSVCGEVLVKQEIIPAVLQYNGSYYTVDPVASDNLNNAITLESGQTYYKEYSSKYHSRYWYAKFVIKENSYAAIGFTAKYDYDFSIRDENGFVVNDFGYKQNFDGYFPLEAGTYYVVLNNKSHLTNSVVLSYSLFENVYCERESNDTFTTATSIGFDQKYLIFSNKSYNNDYLSFDAKKGQKITVYVYGFEENKPSISLYKSDRNTFYSVSMNLKFDEKKKAYYYNFTSKYDGIYFIKVNFEKTGVFCSLKLGKSDCSNHIYKTNTAKASLSKNGKIVSTCSLCGYAKTTTVYYPKTIKLSATSYTYNGKTKTPSVTVKDSKGKTLKNGTDYTVTYPKKRKLIGKYIVTVTFKGNYSGTKKLTFEIVPAKVNLSKLTAGSKALTAAWKTVSGVTGYEVQYSTSSKFTSKTTKTVKIKSSKTKKTTIKKLTKGKKYYVRIRAYKTVSKKPIYGAWSSVKNVKVK